MRIIKHKKTVLTLFVILLPLILLFFRINMNSESTISIVDKYGNETIINEEEYESRYIINEDSEKSEHKRELIDEKIFREELDIFLNTPQEPDLLPVNNWEFKGPYGANVSGGNKYCGMIRDLEVEGVPSIRAAGQTGGLFKVSLIFPVPLADNQVTSRNMGAFATDPNNSQAILLGTGGVYNPGTGLWRTTNEGANWILVTDIPQNGYFTEIKYMTGSSSIVLASHSSGLYRSTNGGVNWSLRLSPVSGYAITWLDFSASNNNVIYAARAFDGVWKSTDGGSNFSKLTSYPLTGANFNWGTLAVSNTNSNLVYVSATNGVDQTSGIHKSTNGGANWTNITGVNMHTQGKRNSCISVSPVNDQLVLVGGLGLYRSTNGGTNWSLITSVHADQCVIKWKNNGTDVYVGNDGGLAFSSNAGLTFSHNVSIFPVMEVLSVDVAAYSGGFIFLCGNQDNSIITSPNNGSTWNYQLGGDGGRVSIDRNNPANWMCQVNSGDPFSYNYYYTTNSGTTWTLQSPGTGYGTTVANDQTPGVFWYCNLNNKVFRKTGGIASSWNQLGADLPENPISAINVGRYIANYAPVYAVLPSTSNKIRVWDGSNWVARNSGLPAAAYIGDVANHPLNNNIAMCFTAGNFPGEKIYRTTNRGVNWINVSGDFPNLTVKSLLMHSTNNNVMFASVQYNGVYKTTNGGTNWFRWMNGMPLTLWVEAMTYMDSTGVNGKFYVVAASHGRGVWVRESGGDDPLTGTNNNNSNIPEKYSLYQNYPNPFNPSTTIKFDLPVSDFISIQIFDITGRLQKVLADNMQYGAGSHEINFNASDFPSGVYFCRLTSPRFADVKKMILLK